MRFFEKYIGQLLFIVALSVAVLSFDQYGMSWDEPMQRMTGNVSYDYVFSNDPSLFKWIDKDYGVVFELPLIILEKTLNLSDPREVHLMRHLVAHIFFLVGCYYFFLLINYMYNNKLLAAMGFLFLLLHPRLYSQSFFNTKDIPFLAMFIISLYYSAKAFNKKAILGFIKLGVCVGILINLRLMGVIMLAGILSVLVLDFSLTTKRNLKLGFVFLSVAMITLYITWPFLWFDPINNLVFAFKNMAQFRWEGTVLFFGELISAKNLEWTYIPVWFILTNPIVNLFLGFLGIFLLIIKLVKNPQLIIKNSFDRTNLMHLFYFIGPIIAVVVLHSVLYDGWRQMYFIYPPFVLMIIYGLNETAKKRKSLFRVFAIIVSVSLFFNTVFMFKNYPVQFVYFNQILSNTPTEYIRKNFEQDYHGVSYKQALEFILKNDSSKYIRISVQNNPGIYNVQLLPESDRKRIEIVVPEDTPDYFITEYRWHPNDYYEFNQFKFHSIQVNDNTIIETFKFK